MILINYMRWSDLVCDYLAYTFGSVGEIISKLAACPIGKWQLFIPISDYCKYKYLVLLNVYYKQLYYKGTSVAETRKGIYIYWKVLGAFTLLSV